MTQAQKTAKAKFKQAIAYRTKTGVSLKEAFAHIYGKKKAAKKVVRKKAARKTISGSSDYYTRKKEGRVIPRKTKRKKTAKKRITEKSILNKIHTVKRNVERLDEAQHKHMMSGISHKALQDLKEVMNKIAIFEKQIYNHKIAIKKTKNFDHKNIFKKQLLSLKKYLSELKTHARELKKHI